MEELCTYETLSQRIKMIKALARSKKSELFSNCYFLPDGFKGLIGEHRLFFEEEKGNLYLFVKEETFFRLYYYIQDEETVRPLTASAPIETELLFRGELTEKQKKEAALIQQLGFSLGRKSGRMVQKASEVSMQEGHLNNLNIRIDFATIEEEEIIYHMLWSTFLPLFSFLPDKEILKRQIEKKNILTLHLSGEMIGLLNMEQSKKNVWIRHLMVKEEHQGTGLGAILVNQYHMLWRDKVESFMHWVNLENASAIRLYQKVGYHFDGTKSDSYILST